MEIVGWMVNQLVEIQGMMDEHAVSQSSTFRAQIVHLFIYYADAKDLGDSENSILSISMTVRVVS